MSWIADNANIIGLLFFFTFFCVMAIWIFRPGSKKHYQDQAHIPLNETDESAQQ